MTPAAAVLLVESETGVFRPIVLPKTTWPVQMAQIQLIDGGAIDAVGRDHLRLHRWTWSTRLSSFEPASVSRRLRLKWKSSQIAHRMTFAEKR